MANHFLYPCIVFTIIFSLNNACLSQTPEGHRNSIVEPHEAVSDFDARLGLAQVLSYNKETLSESLSQYEILIREQPGNIQVNREIAAVYIQLQRYPEAQKHLNIVLLQRPGDYESLVSIGDVCLYAGNLKEAIAYYKRALSVDPSSIRIRKKLGLALSWAKTDDEALTLLSDLYKQLPDDKETSIELARIYTRKNEQYRAIKLLYPLLSRYPYDVELLVETADVEASLGHAAASRKLYLKALDIKKDDEVVLLKFADVMNLWGDFYGNETIYSNYLGGHPDAKDVQLKLAWVLVSSERYEEAEGMYRLILYKDRHNEQALLDMARLKLLEKDFATSLTYSQRLISRTPGHTEALFLKGEALTFLKRYTDALEIYHRIAETNVPAEKKIAALVNTGKIYLKQNAENTAKGYFERARQIDPKNIKVQFYLSGFKKVASSNFLQDIINEEKTSPMRLVEWAELYAASGYTKEAVACYESALKADPRYYPASSGLAQMLAVDHQYKRSIELFESLITDFQQASKILIWHARVLSWSKEYDKSIEGYKKIETLNPNDPVPRREKARVAVWGKMMDDAGAYYEGMYAHHVDSKLLAALKPTFTKIDEPLFAEAFRRLQGFAEQGSIYEGYEGLTRAFESNKNNLREKERDQVALRLLELLSDYRIQKAAYLEKTSKLYGWNKKFTRALDTYEELMVFSPGNEEAIFDYAQAECSLGLCGREAKTYEKLLNIDPLHSLAGIALDRQKIRKNPSLQSVYSYWMEDGRGDLSQITRNRFDLSFDAPLFCQYHFSITGHKWFEQPWFDHRTYSADGYTAQLNGTINPYARGALSFTQKRYSNDELSTRNTGYANIWFNMKDYAHIGLGYDRADELYNYFGLKHGVQSDSWWMALRSDVTRKLEVNAKSRFLQYNDNNEGQHHFLSAGYAFTDHPGIFKVTLSGEYRDTTKENVYTYNATNLVDITYPYWTPKNYTATGITFEWYHDYSKLFFCGNELRFYSIKVSFGADSENNPSVKLEGGLHHEFYDHWTASIKGMWHSSPQWNATGLWAIIKYQF